jgi:outer membrane protein assembly factor BamB
VWSVNLAEKDGWFSRTPALLSGGVTVSGGHVYIGSEKAQLRAEYQRRYRRKTASPAKRCRVRW